MSGPGGWWKEEREWRGGVGEGKWQARRVLRRGARQTHVRLRARKCCWLLLLPQQLLLKRLRGKRGEGRGRGRR